MSKQHLKLSWMSLVVAVMACREGQPPSTTDNPDPDPADTPAGPLSIGPERTAELATHAALAFRATADGFAGGYTTQRATVRDDVVELTPFTFERGERQAREPMLLQTTAITLDDAPFGGVTGRWIDNGAVVLERDQIEERLRNEVDGLHQEWHFKSAPDLSGDIVVEVAVFGQQYTSTTDAGVHFASAQGGGFRYSHAIWIDASGTEWPIAAVVADGRIRMTVPESVVTQSVFPAVLDPTVTAEVVADNPVIGPTGRNTQVPAIASDGTGYLVVWEDERNSNDADIWATRLDAAGAIVDALGIEIATAPGRQRNPTVAFNGSVYVVAWEDFKVADGVQADIDAATVSTAGAVTALPAVTATAANETQPAIAAGGGTAFLTWNSAGDIRGAIHNGSFGAPFAVAGIGAAKASPAVALAPGGNYLAVWSEGPGTTADVRGQLVTPGGALSGAAFTVSAGAGAQLIPAAAFDGTNYVVVWLNNNLGVRVFGTRISTAATVLDTHLEGAVIVGGVAITNPPASPDVPSLGCVATGCAVLWQDRRNLATTGFDLFGQMLTPAFTPQGTEFIVSNASLSQFAPVLTAAGGALFATWTDTRDGETNTVFGGTLSSGGASGPAHTLVSGNNRESQPTVGLGSNVFGVFWTDSRALGNDIRFVRFTSSASKPDVLSRPASLAANSQISPAASGDLGGNTLVVWSDTRLGSTKDIFGARVSMTSGASLDDSGFAISTAANDQLVPAVASNGSVALVTWQDRRNPTFDIFGALVTSAGVISVPDIAICASAVGDQTRPSVTWNNASQQFIVVWSDNRSGTAHIFAARVSPAGVVLDPNGVAISNGPVAQLSPSIASDSAGSFAVWEDRKQGQDIFGTRLSGGAALVVGHPDGVAVSTAAGGQLAPRIASLGTSYVAVWTDSRNTQTDIFGQQLTSLGVLNGPEFVVSNSLSDESNPAITKGPGNNNARVAYETHRLNTLRVASRALSTSSPNGGTCTTVGQCESGFCVDGHCCDTACGGNNLSDCQGCSAARTGRVDGVCSPYQPTSICRNNANVTCDAREYCDGVTSVCPPDVGRNAGLTCSRTINVPPGTGTGVCPAAGTDGAPHLCQ